MILTSTKYNMDLEMDP